jgi:hypothetical protein
MNDILKRWVKTLYRLLSEADEDMAYQFAVNEIGEEDMWVVE